MDQLSADLDFPFTRNGSLVLCFEESQIPELEELADRGRKNGVPGLSIVTGEEIKSLEPALSRRRKGGACLPHRRNCMSLPDDNRSGGKC